MAGARMPLFYRDCYLVLRLGRITFKEEAQDQRELRLCAFGMTL